MGVPVRNIYYLLCYAWDRLEARDLVDAGSIAGNRIENLLGKVLHDGVAHLIRAGYDRGYVEFADRSRRLRGKVLLAETFAKAMLQQGRVACLVDELSPDVPHNRVIKAAMAAVVGLPGLDKAIAAGLHAHLRRFHEVSDVPLSPSAFRQVQLHRNLARYAFLVHVAQLVSKCFIPDEKSGQRRFHPFTASEQQMGILFQSFVLNFLRREQLEFSVTAPKIPWDLDAEGSSDPSWLPEMRTDIVLAREDSHFVIETKYYAMPFQSYWGSKTVISSHLYQLLAYLGQLRGRGTEAVGVLLYAGLGPGERLQYRIGGHTVLIRSLDLDRDWIDIHNDLLGLASELRGRSTRLASA